MLLCCITLSSSRENQRSAQEVATHRNTYAILREATSETYGPGSTFHHISFRSTILVSYLLSLQSFTFRSMK